MYTLLSHTSKYLGENVKLLIHLFDKVIAPLWICNCELWGSTFISKHFSRHNLLSGSQQKKSC